MATDTDLDRTRRYAVAQIKRVLGIAEPTSDRLFAKARTAIGQERANQCLELARLAPLSRRWVPTSAIAALVAGTQYLGPEWWTRGHEELDDKRQWVQQGIPDMRLNAGHGDLETEDGGSCLAQLALWISDDAADKAWGRPVERVDLSDARLDGRVGLPEGAQSGDRLVAAYAPGGRVWVDVIDRNAEAEGGASAAPNAPRLGTRLAERRSHDVAVIRSAWSLATSTAPIRLPGEMAGRAKSDPYADTIDPDVSRRLYEWARSNAMVKGEMTGPWRTKDTMWSARLKLGLVNGRPGAWHTFDDAVTAVVDDDRAALQEALTVLDI